MNNLTNIRPKSPDFIFGYWRPWKEKSDIIDSYLDYARDKELAKYGADTVGTYIAQASKEQVNSINNLARQVGIGIDLLSNKLSEISTGLNFLNRNIGIQIEQQKLSNLLLQNISELLRVPDSEKERQHAIELGINFFVKAQKDDDLFDDSLEELLKAESLMKQDYFVLHRLGLIYMHAPKHINVEKALGYFIKAAKYAVVENDPNAMRLINALNGKITLYKFKVEDYGDKIKKIIEIETIAKNFKTFGRKKEIAKIYKEFNLSINDYEMMLEWKKNILDLVDRIALEGVSKKEAEHLKEEFEKDGGKLKIIPLKEQSDEINISEIIELAAESYEAAAFATYVLGRFELAVTHQSKALKFKTSAENYFMMARYQTRIKDIDSCLSNLEKAIDMEPAMVLAVFRDIDLMNEPEVLKLVEIKNKIIDDKIIALICEYENDASDKIHDVIRTLKELKNKTYALKISEFYKYTSLEIDLDNDIDKAKKEIDDLITLIHKSEYVVPKKEFENTIKLLQNVKANTLEKMHAEIKEATTKHDTNHIKIGINYAGGVVVYIDETGKHGLVAAQTDLGKAIWGGYGVLGTKKNIGSGKENTKLILENVSYYINKGFWGSSSKTPAPTAARLCTELNLNGYEDWFLPSKDELNEIFKCDYFLFTEWTYWSSSESGDSNAWTQDFEDGDQSAYDFRDKRDSELFVRAVRVF